jgi:integration host factor subunit beta
MKKSELVSKLARQVPALSESLLKQSVNIITQSISTALVQQQRIEIRGFGCITARRQSPRLARNPKTGKTFTTEGGCKIHFKPSNTLRSRIGNTRGKL